VYRSTLIQPTRELAGQGLFSAQHTSLVIHPADAGQGVVFTHQSVGIPAHIDFLSTRPVHPVFASLKPRCTSVGADSITVATIEHLLSAIIGLGITDATIAINADEPHTEVPILDGSSKPFVDAIQTAGITQLDSPIEPVVVRERIEVVDGDASITITPSDSPSYSYAIDYPNTPIGTATVTWRGEHNAYNEHIAPARTFSLEHEAVQMQAAGMFTHLTPKDMLVIADDGPIDNEFRFADECARHKLLDLIGDLALVGRPIKAEIQASRSGHSLAHEAARAILQSSTN
jgi:UDP-3-O-acyl N-acetylglucosamine deacetylase